MVIYDDIVFCKSNLTLGIACGSEAYESMVEGWHNLACSGEVQGYVGKTQVGSATRLVWLAAFSTHGNLGCSWVKVDRWSVFRELETTGARVFDVCVVLIFARALGL